jgi:hypothetical protein
MTRMRKAKTRMIVSVGGYMCGPTPMSELSPPPPGPGAGERRPRRTETGRGAGTSGNGSDPSAGSEAQP